MNPPNPTNPIASYLRHLIVVGVVLLVEKFKFPMDGADAFADSAALSLLGSVTWLLVKYLPTFAKIIGLVSLVAAVLGLFFSSCSPAQIAAAEAIPIHATAKTSQGTIGYDSATGVSISVDATSGK
ncbi:MAG: hypothetical protein WCJ66_07690 [Verrucomicrobiota bacterium]